MDERWFWSAEHQRAESEAEDDVVAGRYRDFDDSGSFLSDLEALHSGSGAKRE
jgi:hypothetical protein